ncbi:MAG: GTP pyrophosphokinase family protein [Lactobacillales bacterium]|nr:GTP pyrophosphokinase family protein [Lactobacillales bacterium]
MSNFSIQNNEVDHLMLKYEFALEELITQLKISIKEFEFNNNKQIVEHIKTRIKSKESAIKKLDSKGYEINIDNLKNHIHDMVGVRIVCSFLPDVYDIVNIIDNAKNLKIKEKRDYIETPKKSGYSSYHIIVEVPIYLEKGIEYIEAEIQIRTMAMDFWASLDHKLQYKFSDVIPEEVKKEMYDCSLAIKRLDNKMLGLHEIVNKYK